MDCAIVPMTEAHLDQVEAMERTCFSDPWSRRTLEELLLDPRARSLAAVAEDGTVLGYASAQAVLDEGYINNVAVRPQSRRQGVASRLLEALWEWGAERQLAFLTLEVRASNAAGQALYAQHGYRAVGRRRDYYRHPREDAILMTREFTNTDETENTEPGGAAQGL